jgi:putative transposase
LNDKKIISDPSILIISWLQTSVLALIGKEKVFKPFWNKLSQELSPKLWLPIEIGSVASPLSSSRASFHAVRSNSWFSMIKSINLQIPTSPMISSPSSTSTLVDPSEKEGIRTRKIRIYPTAHQKTIMMQWMGTRRYVYNKTLHAIKTKKDRLNAYELRNKYVTAKNNPEIQSWELNTPKDIRAVAIRDLEKNFNLLYCC